MDHYELLLHKILEKPFDYLSEKSLKSLRTFLNGYKLRCKMEQWEKESDLNYFEHNESRIQLGLDRNFVEYQEFNIFVHIYYNHGVMRAKDGTNRYLTSHTINSLIIEKSNSEEEAFDKYFELREKYLSMSDKEIKDLLYPNDEAGFLQFKEAKEKDGIATSHPTV